MGETGGHARKGVKVGLDGEQGNGKVAPLLRPTELFGAFFRQTQLLGTQAFLFGFGGALLRQAELFGMFFRQTQLLGTLPTSAARRRSSARRSCSAAATARSCARISCNSEALSLRR